MRTTRYRQLLLFFCVSLGFAVNGIVPVQAAITPNKPLVSANVMLVGELADDTLGYSVSIVDDINGDGVDDMVLGAPMYDSVGATADGKIYVIFGDQAWSPEDEDRVQDSVLSQAGATYVGENPDDRLGDKICAAGDVNGDGYGDFLVSAAENDSAGENAGKVYLFFGKAGGWQTGSSAASADVAFTGESEDDYAGTSIAGLGDFNGDGYSDFAIGAPHTANGGKVYLVFGKPAGWKSSYSLSEADVSFLSEQSGTLFGSSVAGVGDVNGDKFDDLVVSEIYYSPSLGEYSAAGKVSLIFGKATGWKRDMPVSQNVSASFYGENKDHYLGKVVAATGDTNGDGYEDFLIGCPDFYPSTNKYFKPGKVYLILGRSAGWMTNRKISSFADASWIGEHSGAGAGESLSGVGDLNGDGMSEILIGSPRYVSLTGKSYILMGREGNWPSSANLSFADGSFYGEASGDQAGQSISGGGDLDGDGFDDLLLGAVRGGQQRQGKIYVNFLFTNEPPVSVSSVKLYNDPEYTNPVPGSVTVNDTLYVELIGVDGDQWVSNNAQVLVASATDAGGIYLNLIETEMNSGVYRSALRTSSRSSSGQNRRIHVSGGDLLAVTSLVPSTNAAYPSASVGFLNTEPEVVTVSATQCGSHVLLDYVIRDAQQDDCTFATENWQIQYAESLMGPWTDAQTSGKVSAVFTDSTGVTHNAGFEPLYWEPGEVSSSYYLRVKPRDMFLFSSSYVTSGVFEVDTIPPQMPSCSVPVAVSHNVLPFRALLSNDTVTVSYTVSGSATAAIALTPGEYVDVTLNLSEGENGFFLYAFDARENRSRAATVAVTLDTIPPLLPAPHDQAVFTSRNIIEVSGFCSTDTVTFDYLTSGNMDVSYTFSPVQEQWSATINNLETGYSTLYWYAADSLGNRSAPATMTIYVDDVPPSPAVVEQVSTVNAAAINLQGTAREAGVIAEIFVEGELVATAQTTGSGEFGYSFLPVSPTRNTVCVVIVDLAGNRSASSNILELAFEARTMQASFGDFSAVVHVPVGALPIEDEFTFRIVSPDALEQACGSPPTDDIYLVGLEFSLVGYPDIVTLNAPVTVAMTLQERVDVDDLRVSGWLSAWQPEQSAVTATGDSMAVLQFSSLRLFTLHCTPFDMTQPFVGKMTFDSGTIVTGDYVAASPTVQITVTDNVELASYTIAVIGTDTGGEAAATAGVFAGAVTTSILVYRTPVLSDGSYYLEVRVSDAAGNTVQQESPVFSIGQAVLRADILHAPNPWNPDKGLLVFGYTLSRESDVSLTVFDLAGNEVRKWRYSAGDTMTMPGYNEIQWDGRNRSGEVCKNGVYLGYFTATAGGKSIKKLLKIAIIK